MLEIRASADGPWEAIGELPGYPPTTAEEPAGLRGGERFTTLLTPPRTLVGVRVRGRGSCGQYPPARYATCGEISAFPPAPDPI
jgi:hypothetical protein